MLRTASYTNLLKVPALLMHGSKDPIIPELMARRSYEKLMSDEHLVSYQSVEGLEHTVNLEQLDSLSSWIADTLKVVEFVYEKNDGKLKESKGDSQKQSPS
jgi:predicted esterase